MIDKKPVCPFCGVSFASDTHPSDTRVLSIACPLSNYGFTTEQWNMRPPSKEQPAMPVVESEVEWLRSIVRDVIAMKVVHITMPNGVKVSEGKE